MKILLFLLVSFSVAAQNPIHWDGKYELQLSDFKAADTQIGDTDKYGIALGGGMEFLFSMSRAEFMFTKNFNSKVSNTFDPISSSITAPNQEIANQIVAFARYAFDLQELYARKLRESLYLGKGTFSDASFFEPSAREIQRQYDQRYNSVAKLTDLGRKAELLAAQHELLKREINDMADFCKECKVRKKK
ncbi:hypothetical protein [Flavobacterium sp.]|uniref:hypothetical protein n=1 Tax=Flavobacterium sp. TaxID=239 RepID=UPI0012191AD5|nr:hypothetical protein [Flavobacterium sp.]RZJ71121.1 MAG: hypothetical protein EOO49_11765 [Flavobacterium sp.]